MSSDLLTLSSAQIAGKTKFLTAVFVEISYDASYEVSPVVSYGFTISTVGAFVSVTSLIGNETGYVVLSAEFPKKSVTL